MAWHRGDQAVQGVVTESKRLDAVDFETRPGNELVRVPMDSGNLSTHLARASALCADRDVIGIGFGCYRRERRL